MSIAAGAGVRGSTPDSRGAHTWECAGRAGGVRSAAAPEGPRARARARAAPPHVYKPAHFKSAPNRKWCFCPQPAGGTSLSPVIPLFSPVLRALLTLRASGAVKLSRGERQAPVQGGGAGPVPCGRLPLLLRSRQWARDGKAVAAGRERSGGGGEGLRLFSNIRGRRRGLNRGQGRRGAPSLARGRGRAERRMETVSSASGRWQASRAASALFVESNTCVFLVLPLYKKKRFFSFICRRGKRYPPPSRG